MTDTQEIAILQKEVLLLQKEFFLKKELKILCKIMETTVSPRKEAVASAIILIESKLNPLREELGLIKLELWKNCIMTCEVSSSDATVSSRDSDSESDSD